MPNEPAEANTLRISHDLYQRLREHCDKLGLRFHDFTEDALENSLLTESKTGELETEIKSLRRKADNYEYAFNIGFRQGFAYLYLMLKGWSGAAALDQDLAVVRQFPAAAPKGVQADLF